MLPLTYMHVLRNFYTVTTFSNVSSKVLLLENFDNKTFLDKKILQRIAVLFVISVQNCPQFCLRDEIYSLREIRYFHRAKKNVKIPIAKYRVKVVEFNKKNWLSYFLTILIFLIDCQ